MPENKDDKTDYGFIKELAKRATAYIRPFEIRTDQDTRIRNVISYTPIRWPGEAETEQILFYVSTKLSGNYDVEEPSLMSVEFRGRPFDLYPPRLLHESVICFKGDCGPARASERADEDRGCENFDGIADDGGVESIF